MPKPSKRTRSKKRVNKALPGGSNRTEYKGKATASSHCLVCGRLLTGVSGMSPLKARKLNRSRRRIWRVHGGQLCPDCLKNTLKQAVRTL